MRPGSGRRSWTVIGGLNRSLNAAAMGGDLYLLQEVLASPGVNPRQADANGLTPLHLVCFGSGRSGAGSSAAQPTGGGSTSDEQAADAERLRCAQALVDAGAGVNAASGMGSPLHVAARCSAGALIQLLVQRGAVVNLRDASGCTPLHLALRVLSREAIATAVHLLRGGADAQLPDPLSGPLPGWTSDAARWGASGAIDALWAEVEAAEAAKKKGGKKGKGKKKK